MRTVLIAAALAGCAPLAELPQPTGPCTLSDLVRSRYVGQAFRETLRDPIQRDTNSAIARVLRPGDAATMDMRPDRLNILVDDGGQIEGLRCG